MKYIKKFKKKFHEIISREKQYGNNKIKCLFYAKSSLCSQFFFHTKRGK